MRRGSVRRACPERSRGTTGGSSRLSRIGWLAAVLLVPLILVGLAGAAPAGQKKKKDQSRDQSKSGSATDVPVRLPDEQAIDLAISEMLGAWQVADVEMLHKYFADDVTVVSGTWEPPIVGWASYVKAYRAQRERMQSGRLDRSNTYVNVRGSLAYAAYQWEFSALVDGKPAGARGHTTLLLEKRKDRWVIVHNHTSMVQEMRAPEPVPPPAAPKPPAQPAAPGPGD